MGDRRIFIALEISDAARAECVAHIEQLRRAFPKVRVGWERPEKLHITLKFLGSTSRDTVEELKHRVTAAAARHDQIVLQLGRPGVFPSKGKPRILWIGFGGSTEELARVQTDLEGICESLGYEREKQPFHPHITIGRVRDTAGISDLADAHHSAHIDSVEFVVRSVGIYESKLLPAGSVHTRIADLRLASRENGSQI